MKTSFILEALLIFVCWRPSHSSTLVMDVVVLSSNANHTFSCNLSSSTHLTRWTYSIKSTSQTSLMSYQNDRCTMSPSFSFPGENIQISYSCSGITYNVTSHATGVNRNNNILSCRDAKQTDLSGSTWMIKIIAEEGDQCNCNPTIPFSISEITEGENVTFICRVSSDVLYVNWNRNIGSYTAAMSGQNGQCTTSGGTTFLDNTSKYIYICNNTVYQVTKFNVTRSEHNDMYMCTPSNQTEGTGSNWIIKVKAPVTAITISPSNYLVNVSENTVIEFTCKTSTSRPAASVYWYIHPNGNWQNVTQITNNITTTTDYNDFSITTSILRFVPTRQDNDTKIQCKANNSVSTSTVSSEKKLFNVLYKAEDPYIRQGNKYRVIENNSMTLSCTVRSGNPTPTLSWSCNYFTQTNQLTISSNGNVTTNLTWSPSRSHEGVCTCISQQTEFTNTTKNVTLVILYPPSKPVFKVNGDKVAGDISFIEGNTRSIECTADSKPLPDRYSWTGPGITDYINIQPLTLTNVKKGDAGQYTCSVHNTMNSSNGRPTSGQNNNAVNVSVLYKQNATVNRTVSVQVLHPPTVLPLYNISKLIGEQFNLKCNYTPGIPKTTLVKWTRGIDNKTWNRALISIDTLRKNDTGIYSCTANNTMLQSGDSTSYIGQHSQSFHLDVQYAASITSFTISGIMGNNVTVNETDPVRFICNADSNPTAVMTLSDNSNELKTVTSNNVEYNIATSRCSNAGIYYCSAQNVHNDENQHQNMMRLFVNCYPRVGEDIDVNITSERNTSAKLVFNVIAYPSPTFTWYQLGDGNWIRLHAGDKHNIESANTQSNLTIRRVDIDDFTSYKVIVKNHFGQMEHYYTLSPYDKPDPPTGLRHVEGLTTTSSIHIEWEPGFDNGPSQTFHIKYKKSSDTEWNYLNVTDNGKSTMNTTLNGLIENTQYDLIIFASNVKGNSTESNVLITKTKAIHNPTSIPGPLIGGIAGGVTGCIVIVIVIVFIIRRYPLFKENGADRQNVRRSVSDDSDDEDGLVDNPMYASSSNVAPVASTSASTSTDIYSKPVKLNKTNAAGNGDIYSVVNKTKGQGKGGKGKSTNEKGKQKEGDVYENVELENNPNKKGAGKQLPPKPPAEQPKLKIVNQDGLIYADLVFKDKPQGEKMVILGDDPTPYDLVDFTKKADPLPESDEEEQK